MARLRQLDPAILLIVTAVGLIACSSLPANAQQRIGTATSVKPEARGSVAGQLSASAGVHANETVNTGSGRQANLQFLDNTKLSVDPCPRSGSTSSCMIQVKEPALSQSTPLAKPSEAVAIISYDEKPGIQAIATTAPDLPPEPGMHPTFTREFEYKRHGTVSLLAGIDLVTGKVHALVKDRHRSREFIEFLKLLDAAYPAHTAIRLILDNHSAHISKETKAWLATRPAGRFEFTFTPKHGSWLNLIEGFFSKLARSVLRHIRVASKQELKDRIMAAMDHFNERPVVHTWSYKLEKAA